MTTPAPEVIRPPVPKVPAIVTFVVPVGISITSASASFLMVTSFVEPCPVKIKPSTEVYPIAALSSAEVSPSGSKVAAVATPVTSTDARTELPATSIAPLMSSVAASNSPEIVRFLCPVVSILASVVTTFEAIAVPAVKPSSSSNSASARTALPAVNPVPVTIPLAVIAPVVVIVSI